MDIGINYIDGYDEIYQYLINKRYINTLKFPGKSCTYHALQDVIKLTEETNAKLDVHGLPEMIPAISSKSCIENVKWDNLHILRGKMNRISTHMGVDNKDKSDNETNEKRMKILKYNYTNMRTKLKLLLGEEVKVGLENIPGGFQYDPEMLTPDFISENWKEVDFGVFDISHAKLAAEELGISYLAYMEKIAYRDHVKILHVSGNRDTNNKWPGKPDKHILIHTEEIGDIIKALNIFKNLDLVISEYAYCSKYSYEKEILIEAITLYTIVTTKNEQGAKQILKYLEENLNEKGTNIEEVIKNYSRGEGK